MGIMKGGIFDSNGLGKLANSIVVPNVLVDSQAAATTNRLKINSAISSLSAAGGGVVLLPRGTIYVNGTGTASDGCIALLSDVTVQGAGRGITIIKLVDNWSNAASAHQITGMVRTPSGDITRRTGVKDLTIDGNRHKQTLAITSITRSGTTATVTTAANHGLSTNADITVDNASDELYNLHIPNITVTGVNTFTYTMNGTPSADAVAQLSYTNRTKRGRQAITSITKSGTTVTVTTTLSHGIGDGQEVVIHGVTDQLYNGAHRITPTGANTFTYTLASTPAADAVAGLLYSGAVDAFFCGVTPASVEQDEDIFVLNCEARHCSRYGWDPHEQTLRFICRDSISWDNIYDGGVADWLVESEYSNCHFFMNGRQGLSIVTTSEGISITNLKTEANGWHNGDAHGKGLIIQQNSRKITVSDFMSRYDYTNGFCISNAYHVTASNINVEYCGEDGLFIEHAVDSTITGVVVYNCSQLTDATYDGITVKDSGAVDTVNLVISNVVVNSDATNKHRRALSEDADDATNCSYHNFLSIGSTTDQQYDVDGLNSTATCLSTVSTTTGSSARTVLACECPASSGVLVRFYGNAWNVTDSTYSWWDISHAVKNIAGTTSVQGAASSVGSFASTDIAAIAADDSDDTLDCNITGIAAKIINWRFSFDIKKVGA